MKLITQGFMILMLLLGSCLALPQPGSDDDDVTTAESIDNIFKKYDQEYPFYGGNNDDGSNVQNDAPAIEAILERLNEIITEDRPNDFVAPNAESSKEQRSLLKKQNNELIFGPSRINRRVKDAKYRADDENTSGIGGSFDFDQTVFFNKDTLAENYNTQVVDRLPPTTTRRTPAVSRIPVRTSTRFPTRRTTTTAAPIIPNYPDRETFIDLVEDEILEKPEGNKLSIPVLSVATEDFEEDLPMKPVSMRPNKLTAQTEDFEDSSRNQFDNYRRQSPMFRKRRDTGSMEWFVNRVASMFNYYGEPEVAEEGRKMSVLSKRQISEDLAIDPIASAIPIPEEVKSVDVPTQVSDAVIETIQDIADPQTRNEFTKDVPAIEDKLDEIEEKEEANRTVEVSVVELEQTEAEPLGRIIEADPIGDVLNQSRQLIIEPERLEIKLEIPKSVDLLEIPIELTEEKKVEIKVIRDQIPDDSSRSGDAPPARIADKIAAIPSELVSVMAPSETIRDVLETARKIEPAVINNVIPDEGDDDEKLSYIEVERVVPMIKTQKTVAFTAPVQEITSSTTVIATEVQTAEGVRAEIIPEMTVAQEVDSVPALAIPIAHTTMLVEDKVAEGDHEPVLRKVLVESDIISGQSLSEIKSPVPETTATVSSDGRSSIAVEVKEKAVDVDLVVEDRRTEFVVDIPSKVEIEKINQAPVPQIKTPIVEQEQDFEIVIEPEAEDEPSPKSLDTAGPEINKLELTTPIIAVMQTQVKDHVVEETVLITENIPEARLDSQVKLAVQEDPSVPLISESADTRLNSMIIAEVLEDENLDVVFNAGGETPTTILPMDWLKEDFSGRDESRKSISESGSSSSTTESTSEWEAKTTRFGSSEEIDSKEDDEEILYKKEKKRLEEEAKRLKEEKKRILKEEKERNKALFGDKSSEEEHDEKKASSNRIELITKFVEPEAEAKFTKEEMVNLFSSPETEMDIDPRILASTAEVATKDTNKTLSSSHAVIKKDRVEIENEDDDSEESGEATTAPPPNELMEKLADELAQEKETVAKVLNVLQHAIDESVRQDIAVETNLVDTGNEMNEQPQETNKVISSKNTRHLAKIGYSEDEYVQKDIVMEGQEARLSNDDENHTSSRSLFLLGSALFLIVGFVLFALVVLIIKRTRRYGSMDLNVQA